MSENKKEKGFFRKLLDKYDEFCNDAGINQGGCRGCVPMVKFDEDDVKTEDVKNKDEKINKE